MQLLRAATACEVDRARKRAASRKWAWTLDTEATGDLRCPRDNPLTKPSSCEVCSAFTRVAACTLARSPYFVTAIRGLQTFRYLHDCSDCFRLERIAGWGLHPLESAALSRRTPIPAIRLMLPGSSSGRWIEPVIQQDLAHIPAVTAIAAAEREAAAAARFAEAWPHSPREVGDHLQAPHFEERLGVELGHGPRSLPVEPDSRQILVDIKARAGLPAFEVRAVGHDAVLPQHEQLMGLLVEHVFLEIAEQDALPCRIDLVQYLLIEIDFVLVFKISIILGEDRAR